MDFKFYYHLLVMQELVYTNKRGTDELKKDNDEIKKELNKYEFEFANIKALINKVLGQNQYFYPDHMDSQKAQDPTNVFTSNKKAPSSEGGHSIKMVACGLSNMIPDHQNSMNSSSRHN